MRSRLLGVIMLAAGCTTAHAAPLLPNGPPRTEAEEFANTSRVRALQQAIAAQPPVSADPMLANDFRNHDVAQPSGARAFAAYAQSPLPNDADARDTASQPRLFTLTDNDLTLIAYPGTDPARGFASSLFEVNKGRITQKWYSGRTIRGTSAPPADPPPSEPKAHADRASRDAAKALVEAFITAQFVDGDSTAAARYLAPELRSHVTGVPSGSGFSIVARKHQSKVTAPDVHTILFAIADGDLVAIGYPVPRAGDPGAAYALNVARVQGGRITDWWYSGYPVEHLAHVWQAANP